MALPARPLISALLLAHCDLAPVTLPEIDASVAPVDAPAPMADARASLPALAQKLARCQEITQGRYKPRLGASDASVAVCALEGAVFFKSGMNVDCDGLETATCNASRDPDFQPQTSGTDSMGNPLDAAKVPYVVLPIRSSRWDWRASGVAIGSVVLVAYKDKVEYGVFADEGPPSIIGEASVAMAKSLGVDPDPRSGGVEDGVTYVVFTGEAGVVTRLEDRAETVARGSARLAQLLK